MSKEYQAKQAALTAEHIKKQDIVITTALIPGRPAPKLVSADMVKSMKPGSVLVDLAVERGGNVEGAKAGEVVEVDGIKIVGYTNVAGRVAQSASSLYARNLIQLHRDAGRQAEQGARGQLGRRAGEGHRADQGRRRHPSELPAESLRREAMEHIAQAVDPFVFRLSIFVLAVFVGYFVVWSVTPALHTPLMSVTNAISSVIVVGALLAVGVAHDLERQRLGARLRLRRADLRLREYLRRLPRHPAHAGDVQEEGQVRRRPCTSGWRRQWGPEMNANLAAVLYLVAGVLFILALRGLSSPASSRQGNLFGMIGMAIAVATTLAGHPPADGIAWVLVILGIAIGGGIGAVIARRVPMTSMPELVAAFHSLVGMAAVLVAAGAFYAPEAFDIGTPGAHPRLRAWSKCRSASPSAR